MKRHDGIPGHETPMHANQHRASLTRHVMKIFNLNTPVIIMQKLEHPPSVELDIVLVHSVIIELERRQLVRREMTGFSDAKVSERFNTGTARFPFQLTFGFAIRYGPRITYVVQLFDRTRESQASQRSTHEALERARDRQPYCFAQSQRSTQCNHTIGRDIEDSSGSVRDHRTYRTGKINRAEQLNGW